MAKRIGFGDYQYEVVEDWPKVAIRGAVADVCVDARGRVYAGVRNPREDGSVSDILGGVGHVLVLDRDGHEVGSWGNLASSPHGIWVNPAGGFTWPTLASTLSPNTRRPARWGNSIRRCRDNVSDRGCHHRFLSSRPRCRIP